MADDRCDKCGHALNIPIQCPKCGDTFSGRHGLSIHASRCNGSTRVERQRWARKKYRVYGRQRP